MSPASIRKRVTSKGEPRYVVYFRYGGREAKTTYAGSFKTKREAQIRRDAIGGELAAGRDPRIWLAHVNNPPPAATLERAWDEFTASRADVQEKAQLQYGNAKTWWLKVLDAERDPASIAPADVQAGIAAMNKLAPSTVRQYVSNLAMVLDHCDVEPNPARSRKVKLPRQVRTVIDVPTTAAWLAIRDNAKKRSTLALRLSECDALRVSEACGLTWGDLDFAARRLRVAATKTAAGRRWLPVPDELLDEIADLMPTEDRHPDARVFRVDHAQVRYDLARACLNAGVTRHGPHDLRHRRISLWLRHGFDPVTVSRWAGHARASMSLDVYGHVILDPREDEWRDFWLAAYEPSTARSER